MMSPNFHCFILWRSGRKVREKSQKVLFRFLINSIIVKASKEFDTW